MTETERVRVKICGLTSLEDSRFASGALADYLGFIFYEESPRYIEPGQAGAIINWIGGTECVGVFVNHPLDDLNRIVRQTGVNLVQLHGDESPGYCSLVEKPVIKAIHIEKDTTAEEIAETVEIYRDVADYLLFDSKTDGLWGGTGRTFDWSLLEEVSGELPFFLSGGLHPGNVEQACDSVQPWGVDLNSGLETGPGVKDFDKIEALMERMRRQRETGTESDTP